MHIRPFGRESHDQRSCFSWRAMRRVVILVWVAVFGVLSSSPVWAMSASSAAMPAQPHIPAFDSCYRDGDSSHPGCDGKAPPPIAQCQNSNIVEKQVNIPDHNNATIGVLQLRLSNVAVGCGSLWGAVHSSTSLLTITGFTVYEANGDNSRGSQYGSVPYTLVYGQWFSTVMVGDCNKGISGCGANYNAAILYNDEDGVAMPILNTPICYGC
jgi:hypothetical protein